jgi:hypothetical protein
LSAADEATRLTDPTWRAAPADLGAPAVVVSDAILCPDNVVGAGEN